MSEYALFPGLPGYWRNEVSGVLVPVVEKYLRAEELDEQEVAAMRAYLRQWVRAPAWRGPAVYGLIDSVERIKTTSDVTDWLADALDAGIDPL